VVGLFVFAGLGFLKIVVAFFPSGLQLLTMAWATFPRLVFWWRLGTTRKGLGRRKRKHNLKGKT